MNLIIADDHIFVREGLRELIENQADLKVIGEADDGEAAVTLCREHPVDIVIMDISMPGLNGIDATRKIKSNTPEIKVIILSMHAEKNIVKDALKAGANGYLLKNSAFDEIHGAIRVVVSGQIYISPQIATIVVSEFLNPACAGHDKAEILSDRERQVLQLLAEGKRSKEIAMEINIGVRSVEKIRGIIMDKLQLYSTAELTKYAIGHGITTIDY